MVSPEQIQAIRERVDIVQMVGAYVKLRKQGQRYVGLCPFHSEKTPSFSVSADKGLYHCFGCHAGGDVFSFVMRHEGLDFQAATRRLAKEAGIELEPESARQRAERRRTEILVAVNTHALAFFDHALWHESGRPARVYLRERALPEPFARERKLGYGGSPGGLLAYLDAKRVRREWASRAGLVTEDGKRSLFDGRLIFPIYDEQGRLAGFGGRRLGEGTGPKYLNSREGPLFAKRRLLYGWEHAVDAIRRTRRVVLVEGYLDVLACHRAGVSQAVAALGTAFTDEHARACARLADEAVIVLDADAAGERASREVALRLLGAKLKTLVAPLPAGEDPDSVVRKSGPAELARCVSQAVSAVEHFIERAFGQASMSIEDRASAARSLAPFLSGLPSGLERDLYLARVSARVGVTADQLRRHLAAASKPLRREAKSGQVAPAEPPVDGVELALVRELLLYPELRSRLGELTEYVHDSQIRALLEALVTTDRSVAEVVGGHIRDRRWQDRLVNTEPSRDDNPEERHARAERTLADVLQRFKVRELEARRRERRRELKEAEGRGEDTGELARQVQGLTRTIRELKRPQGATEKDNLKD